MEKREMKHGKVYVAKRLRLVEYLRDEHGFLPFAVVPDSSNPRYNVYLYNNSCEFEDAIDAYFEQYRK